MAEFHNIPHLVSVVIATYNNANYLAECVESVQHQTYKEIEVIIIDDGSTDNTSEVVKELQMRYQNIRYQKIKNSRAPAARNVGILMARGEYISALDADDLWPDYKLAMQVKLLRQRPNAIVLGNVHQFTTDSCGEKIWGKISQLPKPSETGVEPVLSLSVHRVVNFNTYLARTDMIRCDGLWDPSYITAHDWELWARLAKKYSFIYVNETFQFYRKHDESVTSKNSIYTKSLGFQLRLIDAHAPRGVKNVLKRIRFKIWRYEETISILSYLGEYKLSLAIWLLACARLNVFFLKGSVTSLRKIIFNWLNKK